MATKFFINKLVAPFAAAVVIFSSITSPVAQAAATSEQEERLPQTLERERVNISLSGDSWLEIARTLSKHYSLKTTSGYTHIDEMKKRDGLVVAHCAASERKIIKALTAKLETIDSISDHTLDGIVLAELLSWCSMVGLQSDGWSEESVATALEQIAQFITQFELGNFVESKGLKESFLLSTQGLEHCLLLMQHFIRQVREQDTFCANKAFIKSVEALEDNFVLCCTLHQLCNSKKENSRVVTGHGPERWVEVTERRPKQSLKSGLAFALDAPWHVLGVMKGAVDKVRGAEDGFVGGYIDMTFGNPLALSSHVDNNTSKWVDVKCPRKVKGDPIYRNLETEEEFRKEAEKRMALVACSVIALNGCLEACQQVLSVVNHPTLLRVLRDPSTKDDLNEDGLPPLVAMFEQDNDIGADILLRMKAGIGVQDITGQNALHVVAKKRRRRTIQRLKRERGNEFVQACRMRDADGRLPVYWSQRNQSPTSKELLEELRKNEITLDDIAGYDELTCFLCELIEEYHDMVKGEIDEGEHVKGILLFGPPGNGKTTIAQAVANTTGVGFLERKASQFINVYVGTGPANVHAAFEEAREIAKIKGLCILFLDEIDSVGMVDRADKETKECYRNTISQLLQEMEGFNQENKVVVMATTNIVENLDSALKRRFEEKIRIKNPNDESRKAIFDHYLRFYPHVYFSDEDYQFFLRRSRDSSCSSIKNLVRKMIRKAKKSQGNKVIDRSVLDAVLGNDDDAQQNVELAGVRVFS